ncbi:acetyl-CoA hydrolase/transferase family protein [uncultured Oscillibacter sp.]|uniref:acetyl-CoA hydrolase/transferase family protein n=1 Tax=uncultured Oscillibacter sp. TaxID=876091 RepID=UPI0025D606F5|nr:acetyl-CoA hydrolase/transferase C-terminal domain-containing protein [uncultured Oscillibacter sp.]
MTELTPTRRGRLAQAGDWRRQYQALLAAPDQAAALIRSGDTVVCTGGANWPYAVETALARHLRAVGGHVELNSLFAPADAAILQPENRDLVTYNVNFFASDRTLVPQGNVHFVPTNLSQTGEWMASRRPRVAVITCAPPDENGWMSRTLWGAHLHRTVLEQCETVIVEVNPRMPAMSSEGEAHLLFHVSEADAIVEADWLPSENLPVPAQEEDRLIAGHIAELVPDGACMQFGLGGLANAVGDCLAYAGKRDLGIHTEVLTNCVAELIRKGVVNNSRKQVLPGRAVGAFLVGDRGLWSYADGNPVFTFKEIDWVNNPRRIALNDRVVSVNNAMEVDLTGQVNAESAGGKMYSGTGGQLEWVIGAQWSNGGKSIIALRSSYVDRSGVRRSKIKAQLPPGSVVTTPRTMVQYVVTEYGVANLKYKSCRERAKALIAIAHPDFRKDLEREMPL